MFKGTRKSQRFNPRQDGDAYRETNSIRTGEWLNRWEELLYALTSIMATPFLFHAEQQPVILDKITKMKQTWMQVDRAILTEDEAYTLLKVVRGSVPDIITKLARMQASADDAQSNRESDYLAVTRMVQDAMTSVSEVMTTTTIHRAERQQQLKNAGRIPKLDSLTFPEYPDLPDSLHTLLADIQERWSAQSALHQSMENAYFLERLVTDYLPVSVEIFRSFKDDDADTQALAFNALQQQMEALLTQLKRFSADSVDQRLMKMRAHTTFLEDRLEE